MSISRLTAALVLSLTIGATIPAGLYAQSAPADQAKTPQLQHFDPDLVDKALDPCNDFYKYACNKWLTANPIPADQVYWSTGSGLELWNENLLRETMVAASANDPKRASVQQKIGDYWTACMDESGIEAAGLKPLQPEFDRIAALKSKKEITLEIAHLHHLFPGAWQGGDNQTDSAFFGFTGQQDYDDASKVVAQIDQGGLSLPNRDYYLKTDDKSKEILGKYRAHIQKMFVLAGEPETQAAADAGTVIDLETAMAEAQMDNVKRRDPKNINNKMTLAQVRELTPSIDWDAYLKAVKAPASYHYIVTSPDFFRAEEKLLTQHPLEHWQAYMRWQVIHSAAPLLSKAVVEENFDFFARTLAGAEQQRPRWRRCVRAADRDLGEALGQAYVDRAFPPASKARTIQMVHAIETALGADIQSVTWMSPATKEQAMTKLKAIEDKIGYPSHWRDFSSVTVTRDSYLHNVAQASSFEFERWVAKIGKPVDRGEWTMTPPTINAYYDPQLNTINFPAGILQPPFFEATMDDSVDLRCHRHGHRTRTDSRLRRPGTQIRRPWQPARLVDRRRRQTIRRPRQMHLRRVHAGRPRRRPRSQTERSADPGRGHSRQRRHPSRTERPRSLAQTAGQVARRQRPRRLDLPPALLPLERILLVRQRASPNRQLDRDHGPAFPPSLPHRQRALEHVRIPAGIRLQNRPENGASQRLPGLVRVDQVGADAACPERSRRVRPWSSTRNTKAPVIKPGPRYDTGTPPAKHL